ncbi:MAG: aminodeoxychorismate synthase component I, partial [Gammaproteobacteria bacterium]|nr:aminodeoxychorismate synthase component I [Gammaproteobacteria bacterium]
MSVVYLLPESAHNLLDYFSLVADLPYAMLLDSAAAEHVNSRFDILVCEPLATLETSGRHCVITQGDNISHLEQDPFSLLKTLQTDLLPTVAQNATDLPFVGGALGYIGYDAGRV